MNTKARLLFIAAAAILMLGGAETVMAGTVIDLDPSAGSISIAPSSIPVPETGSPNVIVGMNKVQLKGTGPGQSTSQLEAVRVQLISNGILNPADIASIRVWFEGNGGNGLYDNGVAIDDINVLSGGPYTFSGNPVDITLDSTKTVVYGGQTVRLYVAIELTSVAATAGATVGVQVIRFTEGGRVKTVTGHGVQKPLDKYRVGLTATGIAQAHQFQGDSAPNLKLAFAPVDTDASTKIRLGTVRVHQVGAPWSGDTNLNSGGVVLYEDTNGNGTYDSGADSQVTSGTLGTSTPHYATLTLSTPADIPAAGKTFFVIANISLAATENDVVKLQIENPSTDITFTDAYADDLIGGADYASVPSGVPYIQKGYITSTSATPTTGNATIIDKVVTPPQPIVSSIIPGNNALNVSRTTTIEAAFSKNMDFSTITPTTFKLFKGVAEVGGGISTPDGTVTAVFTPSLPLEWGTTYTVRIYGGTPTPPTPPYDAVQAVDDPKDMQFDKVWSFTTETAVYPMVLSTSPQNGAIEVSRTTTVTATFSKAMESTSINASSFTLYQGATPITADTITYNPATRTATFTLPATTKLDWGKLYTASLTVDVRDTDSLHLLSVYTWTFTATAPVNPLVSVTSPTTGESQVALASNVTATFSKDMDPATIDDTRFTLKDHLGAPVGGDVSYNSGSFTATFNPTADLAWGETYTATIKGGALGVQSLDDLPMLSDKVWTFTTIMPDYPIVISRTPVVGEVEVDIDSNITATFSKDIDASSIVDDSTCIVFRDTNANHIYNAGTDVLVSSVATRTDLRIVTIDPDDPLVWNTTYYVNITTGVKDTDGLYMENLAWWYFVTKVPVNPVVANTVPAPDATGAVPTTSVTVSFSKDMVESDTEAAFTLHVGDAGGAVVPGTAHLGSPQVLTFTPASPLTPGQKYTAVVHGDGVSGSARATDLLYQLTNKTWSFWVSSRPEVLLSSPADGSVGVSRTTTIKAVFSKDIQDITGSTDKFLVEDGTGTPVSGAVTYDDSTFTATFAPDADLLFSSYTVTIKAGPTGILSTDGIQMAGDESWTFTTIPSLTEPVAANNKITPSSTSPVTIFIPQPPRGAADKVTVQVFTATGKKVATLVNNQAWSVFQASLPLEWDGTNGLGEPLGPGLYFIQIRATDYLRTLKVMIVR